MSFAIPIFIVLVVAWWGYRQFKRKKETLSKLKNNWGQLSKNAHNWEQIKQLHQLQRHDIVIDDATWADLDMNELFKKMDRTQSYTGQAVLYDLLKVPLKSTSKLKRRQVLMEVFSKNAAFRTHIQYHLLKMRKTQFLSLPHLLYDELPEIPSWHYFFFGIPLAALLCILLALFYTPAFFLGLAVIPVLSLIVQYIVGGNVSRYTVALSALAGLLQGTQKIIKVNTTYGNPLEGMGKQLEKDLNALKTLAKRLRNFSSRGSGNDLMTAFIDYMNLLFLVDINLFTISVKAIIRQQAALRWVFHTVGYIDALQSMASFKRSLKTTCTPYFNDDRAELSYTQVYHPILKKPVANSIHIKEKGILITGSNMSGKSTFLKTVAVNQILAQTFYFCCADKASLDFRHVISSVRRQDNITRGDSYYLSEVKRVKKLLDAANHAEKNLFLLDEIFHGTNTLERISASMYVLQWLNQGANMVLASTHDLELTELLGHAYRFYHFTETVDDKRMSFDYTLHEGYASTRNAIKLLHISGYPDEIVDGALKVATHLEKEGFHRLDGVKDRSPESK